MNGTQVKHIDFFRNLSPCEKLERNMQTDLADIDHFCMKHSATEMATLLMLEVPEFESQWRPTILNDLRDSLLSLQATAGKILLNRSRPLPARPVQLIIHHSTIRRYIA